MIRTIYDEQELRNKLSKYANERIEIISCDDVQIRIIFKEGYATSFLNADAYDTEIYFYSVTSMKEACKKAYLVEGQENLKKAKAEQEQEEKKENKKMNNNLYTVTKEVENGKKQVCTKCGYVFKETGLRYNAIEDLDQMPEIVTVEEYNKIFWSDYQADFSKVDPKEALKALEKAQQKEDKKEDKALLSPSLREKERELSNSGPKEVTSLRLDLTDSEREAIHYLFELEKDRRNGIEWTTKEKNQAQKALDTLTDLGILDKFPNIKDFEPDLEDLNQFKFYKSESFYEGGYLPTAQAIEFLELTYQEMVDHDKVMALLQIPLNVLNVTEYLEVLPHSILRIHLKQGSQYQGLSFIDSTVGQYQAFSVEKKGQPQQLQSPLFDLDEELQHFEEEKEQELTKLENDLFDLDAKFELFEIQEEQAFINNYFDYGVSFEEARRIAVQSAEQATGYPKNTLLDKRLELQAKIEIHKLALKTFKTTIEQYT